MIRAGGDASRDFRPWKSSFRERGGVGVGCMHNKCMAVGHTVP
jgi:hypothetical protein